MGWVAHPPLVTKKNGKTIFHKFHSLEKMLGISITFVKEKSSFPGGGGCPVVGVDSRLKKATVIITHSCLIQGGTTKCGGVIFF